MNGEAAPYPINLTFDYPDRDLNRQTTFFRIFTVIPITVVLGLLLSWGSGTNAGHRAGSTTRQPGSSPCPRRADSIGRARRLTRPALRLS